MTTSLNNTIPAREPGEQQVVFARFTISYDETGISSGVAKCSLPSGAIIIGTDVHLSASFNANSTNVLTVGSNSTQLDNVVAAADVNEASGTYLTKDVSPTGTALGPLAADTTFYGKYTQTGGTAATSGAATVIIKYVPQR